MENRIPCRFITYTDGRFDTPTGEPEPGDMWFDPEPAGRWDSEAHQERGGGPHLTVRLPNRWDWDMDGPMSNGPGWERAGDPPHITAAPSIVAGDWHGWLRGGELIAIDEEAERRRFPRRA
ncbi:MAG: hypothetical protein NTZ05_23415 [Chloroflexi bacterium]|nr:hypothetical protein [Chloroflexota bacterium]